MDVRDGGAYADNVTWLTALIARECNCQCFVFWNVGTSFLLSGGSVGELLTLMALSFYKHLRYRGRAKWPALLFFPY